MQDTGSLQADFACSARDLVRGCVPLGRHKSLPLCLPLGVMVSAFRKRQQQALQTFCVAV